MKKLITLLLALILVLLPLSGLAETWQDVTLSDPEPQTYNIDVAIRGNVTVENGAEVTFNRDVDVCTSLTVETGASVICNGNFFEVRPDGTVTVKFGSSITANAKMNVAGTLWIHPGATVTANKTLCLVEEDAKSKLIIGGRFEGKDRMDFSRGTISLLPGGELDVVLSDDFQANALVSKLQADNGKDKIGANKDGCHVTAHGHKFTDGGACEICGYECTHQEWEDGHCAACGKPAPVGVILSQGNLWIVLAVAVTALAAVVILVVMKKKNEAK